MKIKAFTLTEVIVGAVICSFAFVGLLTSFIFARGFVQNTNKRLVVSNLIKGIFADLNSEVRADTWDLSTGAIYAGAICPNPDGQWCVYNLPDYNIDGVNYTNNTYKTREIAGQDYREIAVEINYPVN